MRLLGVADGAALFVAVRVGFFVGAAADAGTLFVGWVSATEAANVAESDSVFSMSRTSDGSHPARPSANSINRSATTKIVDRLLLLKFNTVNCFHIDLRSGLEASAGIRLRPAARRRKATGTGKALLQKSTHHAPVEASLRDALRTTFKNMRHHVRAAAADILRHADRRIFDLILSRQPAQLHHRFDDEAYTGTRSTPFDLNIGKSWVSGHA